MVNKMDMNMEFKRKLPTAQAVKEMYAITPEMSKVKKHRDKILKDIFTGKDDRFIFFLQYFY